MRNNVFLIFWISLGLLLSCSKNNAVAPGSNSNSVGKGGSLATFTIINDYLYTVDNQYLQVFHLEQGGAARFVNRVYIGIDIEAIFPFKDRLFIASRQAMYVYDLANPELPSFVSATSHFTGCDPVVANDTVAFVTIHGGNQCGSTINELLVYNIVHLQSPIQVNAIMMHQPIGLGLHDTYLYVCDKQKGLHVFDVQDAYQPVLKNIVTGQTFIDVIPEGDLLICMLADGIAYYDISNRTAPVLLKKIN